MPPESEDNVARKSGAAAVRATITEVRGRGSSPEPGLAVVHSMTLETPDGGTIRIGRPKNPNAVPTNVELRAQAVFRSFDRCPICLTPTPKSREHVPPESVGGAIMTLTCHRCNNDLGSRVEADLTAWFEGALVTKFEHDSVPGKRHVAPILIRENDVGEPVLVIGPGPMDPAIYGMLDQGGAIDATFRLPDPNRVHLAMLKSAYLSACLFLDDIPPTDKADQIRAELLDVRDRPRSELLTLGPMALGLSYGRIEDVDPAPGEVALALFTPPGADSPQLYISLARVLLVRWPLEPLFDNGTLIDGQQ